MVYKILKYLAIALFLAAGIYVILNASYFGKQLRYFFSETFVTDDQREFAQSDRPVKVIPNQIHIPTLDIVAPIKFIDGTTEEVFQKALQDGVVLYPGTAKVGTVGNTYIFGHSSDFAFSKGNYKTVFALLPSIELGAEIKITNEEGEEFTYKVYEKFVAAKTATHLLNQDTKGRKILTLQTSYPIGTALQRYIVKAELVEKPR